MKKSILLYAATFLALSANAAPIGQAQALKLANKFFAQNSVSKRAAAKMAFKVTDQANKVQTENDLLYVINNGNADGYIILAGDNRVAPVLAYADKGHLEESMTTVNPNLQWMLEHYTLEMEWVQTNVKDVPHKAYQQLTSSVQVAEKTKLLSHCYNTIRLRRNFSHKLSLGDKTILSTSTRLTCRFTAVIMVVGTTKKLHQAVWQQEFLP